MSEELTAEERALCWGRAGRHPEVEKLLRLYDAALARAEAAEKQRDGARKAFFAEGERRVSAESLLFQCAQDIEQYKDRLFAAESRLAEATALLGGIKKHVAVWANHPLENADARARVAMDRIFDLLSATPAQAAEPCARCKWADGCQKAETLATLLGEIRAEVNRVEFELREFDGTDAAQKYAARGYRDIVALLLAAEHSATPAQATEPEPAKNPLLSFDARDWARELLRLHSGKTIGKAPDGNCCYFNESDALRWFANALMRGHDEHRWQQEKAEHPDTIALRECRAELERTIQRALEGERQAGLHCDRAERNYEAIESVRTERDTALSAFKQENRLWDETQRKLVAAQARIAELEARVEKRSEQAEAQMQDADALRTRIARAVAELDKVDISRFENDAPHEARRIRRARGALL